MLSANDIELIKNTAPALATDGERLTKQFYKFLFEQNPELNNIFNMNNQNGGDQQHALARAVYAFAAHIDNLGAISNEVGRIAQKHASLSIKAEHYPLVGSALIQAIKEVLNPPANVVEAWRKGYEVLADIFIKKESHIYQQKADDQGGWQQTRPFNVVRKVPESELVTSFYLAPQDGKAISQFLAGQYIAIYLTPADAEYQQVRQYSLSNSYKPDLYRISVKREDYDNPKHSVSNYLHQHIKVGDTLNISPPFGDFHLQESNNPVVLISGGVGITPIQSMLETLIDGDSNRDIHFVHGTQSNEFHTFSKRLQQLSLDGKVSPHIFYEMPSEQDRQDNYFQHEGRINLTAIEAELPLNEAEFYLCGPLAMMKSVYSQLKALNVSDSNIFYEVFGPTKSLAD